MNGEAIYKTKAWTVQNDTLSGDVWYTKSKENNKLYAILLSWPKDNILELGSVKIPALTQINLLGYTNELDVRFGKFPKKIIDLFLLLLNNFFI